MSKTKPTTVNEYIGAAPQEAQDKLREIRALLKEVAPHATETLKWGSPVFEKKRILFSYSAHKSHLNFMPTRSTLEPFKEDWQHTKPAGTLFNSLTTNHCQKRSFKKSQLIASRK